MRNFRETVDRILTAGVETFGERVSFQPQCGGIFDVIGVFDNNYHTIDPSTQQIVEVTQPSLGLNLNDIKFDLKAGDLVTIRKVQYRVEEKNDDGQGGTRLFLHKASLNERIKDTRFR